MRRLLLLQFILALICCYLCYSYGVNKYKSSITTNEPESSAALPVSIEPKGNKTSAKNVKVPVNTIADIDTDLPNPKSKPNKDIRILPFGNFAWTDGIVECFDRLDGLDSIETYSIKSTSFGTSLLPATLNYINQSNNANRLMEFMKPQYRNGTEECFGVNMTKKTFFHWDLLINSDYVYLNNIKFSISLLLKATPGLLHTDPKVPVVGIDGIIFPHLLTEVNLVSKSPVNSTDFDNIYQQLVDKYSDLQHERIFWGSTVLTGKLGPDSQNAKIEILFDGRPFPPKDYFRPENHHHGIKIKYECSYVLNDLQSTYKKYEEDVIRYENSRRPNSTGSL